MGAYRNNKPINPPGGTTMISANDPLFQKLLETTNALRQLSLEHWLHYELFTWQWWMKFIYLILPILLLIKLLDRKRIFEIVTYGLIISLISTVMDVAGLSLMLWQYPIRFLPVGFFAIHDLFFIPIISMLLFQYCNAWKSFAGANLLLAAVGSFIEEPLAIWIKIYHPLHWKHLYSFFVFFAITMFSRLVVTRLKLSHKKALE
jgi:hypothetical protein